MQAVRQVVRVIDRKVIIDLPAGFDAEQVEVIVLPAAQAEAEAAPDRDPALAEFLALDTSGYTPEQKAAHKRASALLRQGREADEPRILGIFEGLGSVADDFDDPLPDEELWWGSETDEYGITLKR